jgi:acyl carrier protein
MQSLVVALLNVRGLSYNVRLVRTDNSKKGKAMREELRKFIASELIRDPDYPLQDDEPLISGGLIDSFSLVELQLFIEQQFGIRIDDTDMTVDSADNMNDIVAMIERYQNA